MRGHLVDFVDGGARGPVGIGARGGEDVHRQQELLSVAFDVVGHLARLGRPVGLGERPAHGETAREEERVRHTPTDRERVDARYERPQDVHLGAHLCSADDREEWLRRILEDPAEGFELLLEEQSGVCRQDMRDALRRRVRAVRGAKGVVHVDVETLRELARERRIVFLLLRVEADVLEEDDPARRQRAHRLLHFRPDRIGKERDGAPEQLAEPLRDGRQRKLRIASGRPAEMRNETDRRAAFEQHADRGQRGADAGVVGDRARIVQRHVEVDAHEHALPARIHILHGALAEGHAVASGRRRQARGSWTRRTR